MYKRIRTIEWNKEYVMERVNQVWQNEKYQECLARLEEKEKERFFCKHNLAHFLDVARIAYIHCLEQRIEIPKDIIYVSALLHDIGRAMEDGQSNHDLLSWRLAQSILSVEFYSEKELEYIKEAIMGHRGGQVEGWAGVFYKADKESRICYQCKVSKECYWSEEKKNQGIII